MKKLYTFLILISLVYSSLFAQKVDMRFKHLSISQGLSQVCVNDIIQDKEGFMWFATNDGLNKYDGYSFTVYKPDNKNPHSIIHNQIKKIYEDSQGTIWIGTAGGGLCKFDKKQEKFSSYAHIPVNKTSISSNDVYSIFEDSKGRLWVGTFGGGLNNFDRKTGLFKQYMHNPKYPNSIAGNAVRTIIEDKNKNIWIGYDGFGLDLYNEKSDDFTHFTHIPNNPNSLSSNVVLHITVDFENNLWIGTYDNGLTFYNQKTKTFTQYLNSNINKNSIPHKTVWSVFEYSRKTIWFGTSAGLCIYNKPTKEFYTYAYDPLDKYSLKDNKILCFFRDRSGLIWIGTENNGINIFDPKSLIFELQKNEANNPNSISGNSVMSIQEDSSKIWLAMREGGLNSIDKKTGKVIRYKTPTNQLLSFEFAKNGNVWLGSELNGLYLYNPKNQTAENFIYNPQYAGNQITNNAVTSILQYNDSIVWVTTWGGGLNKLNTNTKQFTNIKIGSPNNKNVGWCMIKDKEGVLWIGTNGKGLLKYNPLTGEKIYFENHRGNEASISNNVVHAILETAHNEMWIGTGGGGLCKFNKTKKTFTTYTQSNGLSNDLVLGILEDNQKNLWISTANGLSRLNTQSFEFTSFFEENGIQGNSFNERACYKNKQGKLYFGGTRGLTSFFPEDIKKNVSIPYVVISELRILGNLIFVNKKYKDDIILKKPIYFTDTLYLTHAHNVFSFEFEALDYITPMRNKYQYKMEGFDKEWINADAEHRIATYTNLDGGTYTFRVRAANSEGVWNYDGTKIVVIIKPPFYKTLWFYFFVFMLVNIIIIFTIKRREKAFKARTKNKELLERAILLQAEQEKLQLSEDKYRSLVETAQELVFKCDENACFTYLNPAWEISHGYTINEMLGKCFGDFQTAEDFEKDKQEFNRHMLGGWVKEYETNHISKDGKIITLLLNAVPIKDKNGIIVGTQGTAIDITHRKEAEIALIASKEEFELLFEKSPVAIKILDIDSCETLQANSTALESYNVSNLQELNENMFWMEWPYSKTEAMEFVQKTVHEGIQTFEWYARKTSGEYFWQQITLSLCTINNTQRILSTAIDITQRKNTEKISILTSQILQLVNQQSELKTILSNVIFAIKTSLYCDAIGIRLKNDIDYNYYVYHGFSNEFIERENSLLAYNEDKTLCKDEQGNPCLICTCGLVVSGNTPKNHELFTNYGSFFTENSPNLLDLKPEDDPRYKPRNLCIHLGYKSFSLIPIKYNNKVIGLLHVASEKYNYFTKEMITLLEQIVPHISEVIIRKRIEEEMLVAKIHAEMASKAKSEFLANMSHEIRTPLNAVIGFSEIMTKTPLNDKQKEYMQIVNVSSKSLLDLINDILDFSKIEAGKLDLDIQKTDIVKLVEDLIDIIKIKLAHKNVELLINIQPNIPRFVFIDPVRIRQVLINLLGNATKFTEEGEIELCITAEQSVKNNEMLYTFSVRDTGIGIPEHKQKEIFESFSQADSSTTRKFGGTGLGLSISLSLIEKMGSHIQLTSTENVGSTFFFNLTLPFDNEEIEKIQNISWIKNVLIVDDNENNRKITENMLQAHHIMCYHAIDGVSALKLLEDKTCSYDVMIIDYNMPYMDGLQVVRSMKKNKKKYCQPEIILHSSSEQESMYEECKELGVKFYMMKPTKSTVLFALLSKIRSDEDIAVQATQEESNDLRNKAFTVLLVDDNKFNLTLASTLLINTLPNAIIIEAFDGLDALEKFKSQKFDIVFMDIQMPIMSGYESSQKIREYEKESKSNTPIIALTAGTLSGEQDRCLASGMNAYLAKPIDTAELQIIIQEYVTPNQTKKTDKPKVVKPQEISIESNNQSEHFNLQTLQTKFNNNSNFIKQMFDMAVESIPEYIEQLRIGIETSDLEKIRFNSHTIKGVARGISFNKLAEFASEIEHSASSDDFKNCVHNFVLLEQEFDLILQLKL